MKDVRLKHIHCENFKGLPTLDVDFGSMNIMEICGENATGKTTVHDIVSWTMFNKDSSGTEKFELRPLNADGSKQHQTVIVGMVSLMVDGTPCAFRKEQKEIWQTKRGFTEQEFKGNKNEYFIDGYPVSESEYRGKIAQIVSEDTFRMITNPMRFVTMPWKDQRQVLMGLASNKSDVELAIEFCEYEDIIDDLVQAPDTDSIQQKYRRALSDFNQKQKELPVRIDEVLRSIEELDFAEMEKRAAEIDAEIAQCDTELNAGNAEEKKSVIASEIMLLKRKMQNVADSLNANSDAKRNDISAKIAEACRVYQDDVASESLSLDRLKALNRKDHVRIIEIQNEIKALETEKDLLNKQWKQAKDAVYEEGDAVCPTCGQPLPAELLERRREMWEKDRASCIEKILEKGNKTVSNRDERKAQLIQAENSYNDSLKQIEGIETKIAALKEEHESNIATLRTALANIKAPDLMADKEYADLCAAVTAKTSEMAALNADNNQAIKAKRDALVNEKRSIVSMLAKQNANQKARDRAEELRVQLVDVSEMAVRMEGKIELLESFIRRKLDYISASINAKFDGICWKLFETQINGGFRPTCELTVNGVPFGSLNNGMRIVAGLKVIQALQDIYGVQAFIFVDNAEAVNMDRFPAMQNQMIYLKVTDDKELTFVEQ